MGLLGDMIVRIKGDTGQLVGSLKTADKQVQKFARFIMSGAGIGGAILIFRRLGKAVTDMVKLVGEQEEAEGKLRSAIKATGREAEISVASISGLANALQRTTVYGDEVTLSAAAMLQQLANLDEKGLKALIPRVQNFAAAMGVDLQTAASLVGKTLGSSTNALSRYGVQLDMSGTKTQKLDGLTKALDDKFAGMAETIGQTTSGKLKILQNQFNDLQQSLALNLLPTINRVLEGLNKILTGVVSARTAREIMSPAGFQTAISGLGSAQNAIQALQAEITLTEQRITKGGTHVSIQREYLKLLKERVTMIQQILPLLESQATFEKKQADTSRTALAPTKEETEAIRKKQEALEDATAAWKEYEAGLLEVVAGFPELTRAQLGLTDAYNQFIDEIEARGPEVEQSFGETIAAINEQVAAERQALLERATANRDFNNAQIEVNNENRKKEEEAERAHQENMKIIRQGMYNTMVALISSLASINSNYYAQLLDDETLTDKERKKLQRDQAKSAKNFSLFGAVITGAEAIISGFASKPFLPVGLAMGALATILTGAQIAAIASQPLPKLARGGKLNRPTMVMAGEAGPEWFLPDMRLEELGGKVADALQRAQITNVIQNNQPIQLAISLDGRQLDAHVQRSIGDRRIVVDKGAVR